MKLGEALSARADVARRIEQLRARITDNARYQEGEAPSEDPNALLVEVVDLLGELELLIRRINRTNATVNIESGVTVTDALARRDVLRMQRAVLTSAADASAGRDHGAFVRQLRSELKMLAALPVARLRAQADTVAQEIRELDVRIQRRNWEVDLVD